MKPSTLLALALSMGSVDAVAQTGLQTGSLSRSDVQSVAPALDRYATEKLANDLWKRPGLSARDRSIVTVAAVITRNQGILLPEQISLALDNGLKPAELSEIITHLAFYAGWGNAMAATAITKPVFEARGIGADQLPKAQVEFLPLDQKAETDRAARVEQGPGQTRDGRWLVGLGVAAAFRNNLVMKSGARVRLDTNGTVTVETDMTDIGTGSYTIIGQTAAEMLGVELDKVVVKLGDSRFPVSSGSGGQWGGNSSTAGVYAACVKLREAIAQKLGINSTEAVFADGEVRSGNRSIPLASAVDGAPLVGEDLMEYGDLDKTHQQSTFGAHFVEVAVDSATAETRIRRMLAVCAAGRILNPKTARSQVIGAMTMGAGAALMEELALDTRRGFFVNHDLAGYEVPVHADIPHQEVVFLDEADPMSSPMKAKGVGELGICGVGAAVANAIYNATGTRIRDYPTTLDKMLDRMPDAA